jgi:hypothetical protein
VKVGDWVVFARHLPEGAYENDPPVGTVGKILEAHRAGWVVNWVQRVGWSRYQGRFQVRLATPEEVAIAQLTQAGGL